jgi:hypothetical protein
MTKDDEAKLRTIYNLLVQAVSDAQEVLEREQATLDRMPPYLKDVAQQAIVHWLKEATDDMDLATEELAEVLFCPREMLGYNINIETK